MMIALKMRPWRTASSNSDDALIHAAKRGDRCAFDRLRASYETPLHGFVIRRVGADAAEDVLQEIWLSCWQMLTTYAGRSRFKAWLYGIAAHKCADCIRHRVQDNRKQDAALLELLEAPNAYEKVELRHIVQETLRHLPDEQREVLELYYYAELTLAEVAQVLRRNLNTVKYQFYRGHASVAQMLPK